jgi:hypothetical protein
MLTKLFNWFLSLFRFKNESTQKLYELIVVSELPKNINENVLYIEGNVTSDEHWYALLKCPCGCNENIMLNLMDDADPCWKLESNESNFSITPSIWRTKNCKSHFWLRNRKIVWV